MVDEVIADRLEKIELFYLRTLTILDLVQRITGFWSFGLENYIYYNLYMFRLSIIKRMVNCARSRKQFNPPNAGREVKLVKQKIQQNKILAVIGH